MQMWTVINDNYDWGQFNTTAETLVPGAEARTVLKPWGHELIVAETRHYTGKLEHVKAGHRLSLQYHAGESGSPAKDETMCLISGRCILWMGDSPENLHFIEMELFRGYRIKPPLIHRLEAIEDCVVVEFSTPETGRTVRLQDDYTRKGVETESDRADPNRGWNPNS